MAILRCSRRRRRNRRRPLAARPRSSRGGGPRRRPRALLARRLVRAHGALQLGGVPGGARGAAIQKLCGRWHSAGPVWAMGDLGRAPAPLQVGHLLIASISRSVCAHGSKAHSRRDAAAAAAAAARLVITATWDWEMAGVRDRRRGDHGEILKVRLGVTSERPLAVPADLAGVADGAHLVGRGHGCAALDPAGVHGSDPLG